MQADIRLVGQTSEHEQNFRKLTGDDARGSNEMPCMPNVVWLAGRADYRGGRMVFEKAPAKAAA